MDGWFACVIDSISTVIMDMYSLEDDDSGIFITPTPSIRANVDNLAELCDDYEDFQCSQIGQGGGGNAMVNACYSDISDADEPEKNNFADQGVPSFE